MDRAPACAVIDRVPSPVTTRVRIDGSADSKCLLEAASRTPAVLTPLCHVCGLFGLGYGVEKFVDSFLARHEKWLAHPSPQPLSQ
jgi:hypothetical protein